MAAEQAPPMGDMDTPDLEVNLRHDVMRHESIIGTLGNEGRVVPLPKSHTGTSIGVFTSGGDSQGMNAAVRAVVRMGLYLGCEVYMIEEGYQGMVDGGDCIRKASWADVSGIIERGGTVIGSARCQDFRGRKGRLTAARNLVKNGITNLVCIGGDGSLTGANLFRNEWGDLLDELYQNGDITIIEMSDHRRLNIVGMVGSIDNDFCGTDMTIGTDTALHRIIEAVDAIATTGTSHQRVFVLEVMGRHCGYLALVAAMACEADFVFIPELPHGNEWEDKLCKKLKQERDIGQRLNVILVAEGAIDLKGNSISATYVKDLVIKRLGYDTRITVLGHVQRGGRPSAFDRVLATRMGAESVIALMDAKSDSPAVVIALEGNQIVRKQLMQCVEKTIRVQNAMKDLDFGTSVHARGRSFEANLSIYKILSRLEPPRGTAHDDNCPEPLKLAVVAVGAPACGANAAVRSFVRFSLVRGYEVYGIYESLHGLAEGKVKPLCWKDVQGWAALGGSMLGTRRTLPETIGLSTLARSLKTHEISGLVVVGGFEAYQSVVQFEKARKDFDEFKIPMIVIPSTISNNVPGTDFSLGCDTSLNEIVNISDKIKLSASGSKRRVFLIETMGGFCGYLATLSALAGGADAAYINEENFSCDDLQKDCVHLKQKVENSEIQRGLILINEKANSNYTTNFIFNLFSEEGKGCFTTRMNILGHMQQGGSASPFDRNMGTKLGMKAAEHLIKLCTEAYANAPKRMKYGNGQIDEPRSAVIVGIMSRKTVFSPVTELAESTDFNKRLPMNQWWLKLRPLLRIMAKHHGTYTADSERTEELSSARPTPRPSPTSSMASMAKNSEFLPVPKLG